MKEDIEKVKKQNWPTWVKLVITAIIGVITAMTIFFTSCNPIRVVAKQDAHVQIENYQLKGNDVQEGNNNEISFISPNLIPILDIEYFSYILKLFDSSLNYDVAINSISKSVFRTCLSNYYFKNLFI